MKLPIVLVFLACPGLLFAQNDPKAVTLLDRAAALHGLISPQSLESFEAETVYSSASGGLNGPSRWLSRVDFRQQLDLGVRYVYAPTERGVFFQRRIEGSAGTFYYGIGSTISYDLGDFFAGNVIAQVAGVSLLAVRRDLSNLTYDGPVTLGSQGLDQVSFSYRGATGTAFLTKDGRYGGFVEVDLKDDVRIFNLVTGYRQEGSLLIPSHYTLFDEDGNEAGYGKVVTFRANPKLTSQDFRLAPVAEARGTVNPFGLELEPFQKREFTGVAVAALQGPATTSGLTPGDQILTVNGTEVTQAYFYDVEALFWSPQTLTLTVLKKDGGKARVKLAR